MVYIYEMPNDKALAANLRLTDAYGLEKYSRAIPLISDDDFMSSLGFAAEIPTE